MLTDKFLENKNVENSPKNTKICEDTPLNRMFACGCCIVIIINAAIWMYIYWYN